MDAPGLAPGNARVRTSLWSEAVLRGALVTLAALLALAGAVLCARQIVGALTAPLSTPLLLSCATLVALGVQVCRTELSACATAKGWINAVGCWLAGTLILGLWGWGLSVPGTSALGLLAVWAPLIAESAWSAGRSRAGHAPMAPRHPRLYAVEVLEHASESRPADPAAAPIDAPAVNCADTAMPPWSVRSAPSLEEDLLSSSQVTADQPAGKSRDNYPVDHPDGENSGAEAAAALSEDFDEPAREYDGEPAREYGEDEFDIWQRMSRRHDMLAGEVINGWLRVELAAGQRHATAHVAICPPLDTIPTCYVEQADGPAAQIKAAQVLAHGIRFEIKLDAESTEPATVALEFAVMQHQDVQAE